jgi:signal transduction histidine kinase
MTIRLNALRKNLFQEETRGFLAEASRVLASSLDYEETLTSVAELAVRRLADWCSVHITDSGGTLNRVAVSHRDPSKLQLALDWADRHPPDPNSAHGVYAVLRSGKAEICRDVTDEILAAAARSPEHLRLLRSLGMRSALIVPMKVHGRVIGAISFVLAETNRRYGAKDLLVAQDLADRAALAVESARLYRAAQSEIEERRRTERELKESQDKFRQLYNTLEFRVAERTSDLQSALRELETFAYSVAHDLRGPLRAMAGFSQALLEDYGDALDVTGRDYARRIADAAMRLDQLTQDLLAYSRLARSEFALEPVELDPLVDGVLEELASEIRDRKATIRVERPLPRVEGHSLTLRQVITNLVSNSLKFVQPDVPPEIRIRAERRNGWIRLWVEDRGIGILPEHHERIFGVFERLNRFEEYPGSGIGLAIVRKGVERMKGQVGVESQLGEGSRFWIELAEPVA